MHWTCVNFVIIWPKIDYLNSVPYKLQKNTENPDWLLSTRLYDSGTFNFKSGQEVHYLTFHSILPSCWHCNEMQGTETVDQPENVGCQRVQLAWEELYLNKSAN